jgi:hypothetical protein
MLGVDLSSRVGIDSMLYYGRGPGIDASDPDSLLAGIVESVGGPMISLIPRGSRAIGYYRDGQYHKAIENVMPKAIKDGMQAYRTSTSGWTDSRGKQYASSDALTPAEYFAMSLGFTPTTESDMYTSRSVLYAIKGAERRRGRLLQRAWIANTTGGDLGAVFQDMADFNRRYPALAITREDYKSSMETRKRVQDDLIDYSFVPERMRSIYLENTQFME